MGCYLFLTHVSVQESWILLLLLSDTGFTFASLEAGSS